MTGSIDRPIWANKIQPNKKIEGGKKIEREVGRHGGLAGWVGPVGFGFTFFPPSFFLFCLLSYASKVIQNTLKTCH
jgi:hypothetical protein